MATLQSIRSKGPLLVIVIGVALFSFIANDAWKVLQPHQTQDVGEINGEALTAQDYQKMVEEETELAKASRQQSALSEEESNQIKDRVWQGYVTSKLVENEADKLGLTVTDAELQAIIDAGVHPLLRNSPFVNPQTGAFDKDMLKMFLVRYADMQRADPNSPYLESQTIAYRAWSAIEKEILRTRLIEKYQALIQHAMLSNPIEAQNSFAARTNTYNLLLAGIPYSSIPDSTITVTQREVNKEYETKKELFKVPFETRSIRYIDVAVTASAEDRAALETEMEEYTGQLKEEVTDYTTFVRAAGSDVAYTNLFYTTRTLPTDVVARLDSVKVGGVFGPYYNASDNTLNSFKKLAVATLPDSIEFRQIQVYTETIERTKTLSDSIFNALKKGADFEEVAKRYGQTGTASWISSAMYEGATLEGDDLNYITTITSLNKNELANLSISAGANIILQVVNKKADVKKYKVAVIKRTVEFSKETYAKAYNEFSQFIAANPTLDQLVGNAEDAGYRLLDKPNLSSIEHTIGGIRGTKDALRWAFAAKVGDVSGLYECGDSDHMLVVALAGITPEGYRPSDDPLVRTQLRADIVRNKKAEKLMTELKAAGATTLAQYGAMPQAVTDSVKLVTFTSNPGVAVLRSSEPIIAAYASVAQEGKLSAPLQGNNGVFVLQEYSKDKLNETYDAKAEEDNLQRTYGMMTSSFVGDLYQKAKVKDNRYLFF